MRIPRDITGSQLAQKLKSLGYQKTRQTGSHIRLTTQEKGEHHLTIPDHNPIKIGTLAFILSDIASHFDISKEELIKQIF